MIVTLFMTLAGWMVPTGFAVRKAKTTGLIGKRNGLLLWRLIVMKSKKTETLINLTP